ncbi:MAG: acyltransferase family protein [Deltaproteobacteria bacterium]|nr:acyltransferase family protein [Deltaproteobacteria bacterium]
MPVRDKTLLRRLVDSFYSSEERERFRALPSRKNEYGYDSFGLNREDLKIGLIAARFMFYTYFRGKAFGVENIPAGRVMLVANHSGQIPFDALGIGAATFFEGTPPRVPRSMLDRFVPTLPIVGTLFARFGQVLGTIENCQRLLGDEECILVFPEGTRGISKPFTQRYQLADFGLGFLRLALASKAPIVPVAVIGAEEQAPAFNVAPLARLFGMPSFPLMPFPPFLPVVPLPSRYRIYFGEPRYFAGDADDDDEVIADMARQVKLSIESMIRVGRKARGRGL